MGQFSDLALPCSSLDLAWAKFWGKNVSGFSAFVPSAFPPNGMRQTLYF